MKLGFLVFILRSVCSVVSIGKPKFSFVVHSTLQVIYIAPLKAIVRERMNDWKNGLATKLGKKMVSILRKSFYK